MYLKRRQGEIRDHSLHSAKIELVGALPPLSTDLEYQID